MIQPVYRVELHTLVRGLKAKSTHDGIADPVELPEVVPIIVKSWQDHRAVET